ncbi:MAG: sugar transferase, partial [Actinomycetes bacterium]
MLLVGDGVRDLRPPPGRTVVGHLGDRSGDQVVVDLRPDATRTVTLGRPEDAVEVARTTRAGTVVLSAADLGPDRTDELARRLSRDGRHVEVLTAVHGVGRHRLRTATGQAGAVLAVAPVGRFTWREGVKRATDVVVASLLLVLCAPVLATAALAVRMADGPGVLFRQRRVGRDGTMFTVLKLRTMVPGAEQQLDDLLLRNEAAGPMFKMR